jgi:hypothetical protein
VGARSLIAAGDRESLEVLRRGAAASDGVIHTNFAHDFSRLAANREIGAGR